MNEKYIKHLEIILKISLEIKSIEQLFESNKCLNLFCELTQTANKYEFFDIERQLSDHILKKWFKRIDGLCVLSLLMETYIEFKEQNIQYFCENSLKLIDKNANKVMKVLDNESLLTRISGQMLIDIFSRDTFGVNEMKIYSLIKKWFDNNFTDICMISEELLLTIRLSKLDPIYVSCVEVMNEKMFFQLVSALKELSGGPENNRISCQPNVWFHINDYNTKTIDLLPDVFPIYLSRRTAKAITFRLPIETTINYIKFKATTDSSKLDIHSPDFISVYYYCEVRVKNQWIKVVDFTATSCFSTQEICFEELIVSAIRLIGITNKDTNTSNRFLLNYLNNDLLHYGFIDKRRETKDNSIVPKKYYLSKSDAICYIKFLDLGSLRLTQPFKYSLIFDKNINKFFQQNCSETIYSIRLTQPLFVNCLELFFFNQSKQKFILSINYCFDSFVNQIPIVSQFELTTDSTTFDFEAKHILWIHIYCESEDKPLRLHDINLYYKKSNK